MRSGEGDTEGSSVLSQSELLLEVGGIEEFQ